jgi:Trk K+ transport system NAD-binding subunit
MRPDCIGVFALTDDEAVNLAVATAARLLRPDMRVLARCATRPFAERLKAIGTQFVVNPYDRFGDFLTLAIHGPATFRLMEWLTGTPGSELPPRREPPRGRWIVCGYDRFGREVTGDLERAGMEVTIIEKERQAVADPRIIEGSGIETEVLDRAGVAGAAGLVAATDNDTSNLTVITAARKRNPGLYIVARQNRQVNAELYQAIAPDFLAVLSRVVAQECLAPLTTPLLVRFLELAAADGDASSAGLTARLEERCGRRVPIVWTVGLTVREAPAIARLLARPGVTLALGDLLRDPAERERTLAVVALMIVRDGSTITAPADDVAVRYGDEILLAGRGEARNRLRGTLYRDATRDYVLTGRYAPAGWLWRQLARRGDSGALTPPHAS